MSTVPSVQDRATGRAAHRVSDDVLRRSAYALIALCVLAYAATSWFEAVNPPAYSSWGSGSALPLAAFVIATLAFPVVGVLIVHRDPRNTIGWLMLAIGVVWAWSSVSEGYVVYALRTNPGSLPRPDLVAALSAWLWVPAIGLMGIYLILLFPDGHLPSRRWRPVAWFGAIGMLLVGPVVIFRSGPIDDASVRGIPNPLGIPALDGLFDVLSIFLFVIPVGIVLSAAALIVRYRRARGIERLQIKWLAAAGALVALVYAVGIACTLLVTGTSGASPLWVQHLQDAGLASFVVIPVAIGVAILKHRLYGIDVV
ncbi:MAG: hypothetical protein QOK15_1558, partial [Nocardioidaceae bacterium]|nr:hypothetical protein [Nocardioidaceae bacterium]